MIRRLSRRDVELTHEADGAPRRGLSSALGRRGDEWNMSDLSSRPRVATEGQ